MLGQKQGIGIGKRLAIGGDPELSTAETVHEMAQESGHVFEQATAVAFGVIHGVVLDALDCFDGESEAAVVEGLHDFVEPLLHAVDVHGPERGRRFGDEMRGELHIGLADELCPVVDEILRIALQIRDARNQIIDITMAGQRAAGKLFEILLDTDAVQEILSCVVIHVRAGTGGLRWVSIARFRVRSTCGWPSSLLEDGSAQLMHCF